MTRGSRFDRATIATLGGAAALVAAATLCGCSIVRDVAPSLAPASTDGPAAVVSAHPLATRVGLDVLEAGGNAADAAVATALALAVVYPQAGNLGGGGFAVWVPESGPQGALALDFRETAPRELDPSDFDDGAGGVDRDLALGSVLAAGVPGSPAGLFELHRRLGCLPFDQIARPAIELARDGFEVDAFLARDLARFSLRARLSGSAASKALFYPDGALAEGELLVQPELATTLERLVEHGPAGFYSGPVADAIVAEMERGGGEMDALDLAHYAEIGAVWRTPVVSAFGERTLVTMPPPSSGGILILQVFEILEGEGFDYADPEPDARELHWWIEALRAGFADRARHLGDPDFHDVPVDELLDPAWIAERRRAIGRFAQPDILPWVEPVPEGGGETTHLSVLDAAGNAVSMTTTLNTTFGTGILVEGAGFLLNNEMDDFAIQPGVPNAYGLVGSEANAIAANKRPLSSMTPTVVCAPDGSVQLVIGSPGGPRIITSIFQVLARVLVHGQSLEEAITAPRLHQQWKPQRTFVESDFPEEMVGALVLRGHAIEREDRRWSSVQAILVGPDGELEAFADPRRGGVAGSPGTGFLHRPARPEDGTGGRGQVTDG